MITTMIELGIATATTTAVAYSINAEPLLTALIGFGISLVTVVGGEVVKFLVAFIKSKTKKYSDDEEKEENKK